MVLQARGKPLTVIAMEAYPENLNRDLNLFTGVKNTLKAAAENGFEFCFSNLTRELSFRG